MRGAHLLGHLIGLLKVAAEAGTSPNLEIGLLESQQLRAFRVEHK